MTISDQVFTDGNDRLVIVEANVAQYSASVGQFCANHIKVEGQSVDIAGTVRVIYVDCPIDEAA